MVSLHWSPVGGEVKKKKKIVFFLVETLILACFTKYTVHILNGDSINQIVKLKPSENTGIHVIAKHFIT